MNGRGARALLLISLMGCGRTALDEWGSDSPHTNFEHAQDYESNHAFLRRMVPDAEERATILIDNPWELCRFAG